MNDVIVCRVEGRAEDFPRRRVKALEMEMKAQGGSILEAGTDAGVSFLETVRLSISGVHCGGFFFCSVKYFICLFPETV